MFKGRAVAPVSVQIGLKNGKMENVEKLFLIIMDAK